MLIWRFLPVLMVFLANFERFEPLFLGFILEAHRDVTVGLTPSPPRHTFVTVGPTPPLRTERILWMTPNDTKHV